MLLSEHILKQFGFTPTSQQKECIELLSYFVQDKTPLKSFILHGYAGTGKTSIVASLVNALKYYHQPTVLLAPTGRAAKVFSNYANHSAWSIHKEIYRQKSISDYNFNVNYNKHQNTIFIVDEASMIGNSNSSKTQFGSGRLLDDLIEYIFSGENCSLILVGDSAQLLPVMQLDSPALNKDYLAGYGIEVLQYNLTQVVRQSEESGILYNATKLRESITEENPSIPKFDTNFKDIKRVNGADLIEEINDSYYKVGMDNTIILSYSNKRAMQYNRGIRNQVMMTEDEICNGDLLLITKNNYFWSKPYDGIDFIANGDIAEISHVGKYHNMYGYRFVDLTLRLVDYDLEIDARILIDLLYAETPQQTQKIYYDLFKTVEEDYLDIPNLKTRYGKMRENEYLNALHVKFAYAITTHKAQGGQWEHVFIDQGFLTDEMIGKDYFQWLYTSFTRAKSKLFLINFNNNFFDES